MFNITVIILVLVIFLLIYLVAFRPKNITRIEIMLIGIEITILGGILLISPLTDYPGINYGIMIFGFLITQAILFIKI